MSRVFSMRDHGGQGCAQANVQTEILFGEITESVRLIDRLVIVAKGLWPNKTAANFAACAKVNQRTAEYWLARKSGMSLENFMALLQSDHGLEFIEAAMGNARPVYWKDFKRTITRGKLRREARELQKRIDENDAD